MSSSTSSDGSIKWNRRRVLEALGVGASAGLAGCGSESGGGTNGPEADGSSFSNESEDTSQELGERVPTIITVYYSNIGGDTAIAESYLPIVKKNVKRLGITHELRPTEFTTAINDLYGDQRVSQLPNQWYTSTPSRLDPQELLRRFAIDWAGGDGSPNSPNYASCEYSNYVFQQETATTEEKRRELVYSAWETWSEELASIEVSNKVSFGVGRNDSVTINGAGEAGIKLLNPYVWVNSQPTGDASIISNVSPVAVQTENYPVGDSPPVLMMWNTLVQSPLLQYNGEYGLENMLASDYEVENDAQRITVELTDSTFHNGDPITAEDVKFTFELLVSNSGSYPKASENPYESISVIDERTIEFNFTTPFLPFISAVLPRWGIMHKDSWRPARENPEGFEPDPMIGSGPFRVADFVSGSRLQLEPHDGHGVLDPGHTVVFRAFRGLQTARQAFRNGEIDIIGRLPPSDASQIQEEMGDQVDVRKSGEFTPFTLIPQYHIAPTKFREFRKAFGMSINKQEINEVAFFGEGEVPLASCPLMSNHPFRPPDDRLTKFTDDPTGDIEGARQTLEEAGWGWDSNGNLHYPPDADLSPLWPKGENPNPGDFPCLNEDGEYISPS